MIRIILLNLTPLLLILSSTAAMAVTGVNPTGVNVKSTGVTTIFLTVQGAGANEVPVAAFWCGEIDNNKVGDNNVATEDPCRPGTRFGNLAQRNNFVQRSGTGGVSNFTDIMTIPSSVARRARQSAVRGDTNTSAFFYVRQFRDTVTGQESFAVVTCRLAGGGARVPLALTDVRLNFIAPKGQRAVFLVAQGAKSAEFEAKIHYNGTGRLKGRWEVVKPGEPVPRDFDLLPAASLPIEQRGLQRRYTQLNRFEIYLPPTGKVTLPGPDASKIPTDAIGPYQLLLRIESTSDKEGDSNTEAGVVNSGGVAGFAIPPLRYYVGTPDQLAEIEKGLEKEKLTLMLPMEGMELGHAELANFSWVDVQGAEIYRLEVEGDEGVVTSALVKPGVSSYTAPPWIRDQAGSMRWRVTALSSSGRVVAESPWRSLRILDQSE
ncbi:MAG: hypothetical protein ABFS45_19245 [Pseudomonadota bacterium]